MNKDIRLGDFIYADSSFFKMFSFPFVNGDRNTCLTKPNSAVITKSFAKKVFKDEEPIGKNIVMSDDDFNEEICEITAVVEDVPPNSHLKFDILLSYSNLFNRGKGSLKRYGQSWKEKDMYTYVRLKEGADPKVLEPRFPGLVDRYNPELLMINQEDKLALQPLPAIHLNSHLSDEAEQNGQAQNVFTLVLVGILILIIAMTNYLNFTVARSMARAKDFGLRKVFGAVKGHLYGQFAF